MGLREVGVSVAHPAASKLRVKHMPISAVHNANAWFFVAENARKRLGRLIVKFVPLLVPMGFPTPDAPRSHTVGVMCMYVCIPFTPHYN